MTPWDSDWAGGTEGSDIRIAKEYGLTLSQIEQAKKIATAVFQIERAVTPFSEYKLRLGIAIMIETEISQKTTASVIEFINNGGKLTVGGDVLLGLDKWQTLIPKPPIVDQLLKNMSSELDAAKKVASSPIMPKPSDSFEDKILKAGFQQKGLEYINGDIPDLSPLSLAPHLLHARRGKFPKNTSFKLRLTNGKVEDVIFKDRTLSDDKQTIYLSYIANGKTITKQKPNPEQNFFAKTDGPKLAQENEFGINLPGEVVNVYVKPGDVIKEGQPIATIESMKMQMQITAPSNLVGKEVERVFPNMRTTSDRGDILPKNGALFSYIPSRSFSTYLPRVQNGSVRSIVWPVTNLVLRFLKK